MAIANYADLQATVANYLHRSDLTALIPDFITLAEAKINRILRVRAMENIVTGACTNPTSLPTGFVEMISLMVTIGSNQYPLNYLPPTSLAGDTGNPNTYTIVGDNIYFEPSGNGTYKLTYYKKFDPLSSGVNWLITNAPDLYLYATLLEAAPYIRDDARIAVWEQGMVKVLDLLQSADRRDSYGNNLVMRAS